MGLWGFPGGSEGRASACNVGDPGSILEEGKISWRRKWLSTPVFLPGGGGAPPWQRSLVGYSPWGHKESDTTKWLTHTHAHTPLPPLLVTDPVSWSSGIHDPGEPIPYLTCLVTVAGPISIISRGLCSSPRGEGEEATVGSDPGLVSRWALPIATSPPHGEAGLGKWHRVGAKRRESDYTEGIFKPLNPTIFLYGLVIWTNKFLL